MIAPRVVKWLAPARRTPEALVLNRVAARRHKRAGRPSCATRGSRGEPNPLSCVVEGFINAHYGSRRHRLSKVCWSVMLSSRVRRPGAATLVSALTAAAMTLTPRAAAQDDDFRAIAGIGPGFAPQYEGAND